MKKYYPLICFIISLGLFTPYVQAFNIAQNICEYIAADDKKRLRKLLKTNHLKLRKLYKDIACNGQNMMVFSAKRQAKDIGELLTKKLPKSVLESDLAEVETLSPDIAKLMKERIN